MRREKNGGVLKWRERREHLLVEGKNKSTSGKSKDILITHRDIFSEA